MERLLIAWPTSLGRYSFPHFSLKERDRRWAEVRRLMTKEGVACLLAPGLRAQEDQANSRYLSQIGSYYGGAWVVFPASGEVTAVLGTARDVNVWKKLSDWITDLRYGRESGTVIERLRELGFKGERVGVTNLANSYRSPDGVFPYEALRRIQEALPDIRFIPNNNILELARMVKGPEEIEVVEKIVAADEDAIAVMCERARPGVDLATVWLAMTTRMIEATGDYPARLSIAISREANTTCGLPIPEPILHGATLSQEICARLQGYRAQCNHSIAVGKTASQDYSRAMNAAVEIYHGLLDWIKPGRTIGELLDQYVKMARDRGATVSGVLVHTNGLGNDRPRVGPGVLREEDRSLVIEPGFTFTIKPSPRLGDGGPYAEVGDPLTVTEQGARRLGQRKLEPIIVS